MARASGARVAVALEQGRRDQVDALVGGLRRQDGRDQQLEGVGVVQLGVGAGMLRLELVENVRVCVALFMVANGTGCSAVAADQAGRCGLQ